MAQSTLGPCLHKKSQTRGDSLNFRHKGRLWLYVNTGNIGDANNG